MSDPASLTPELIELGDIDELIRHVDRLCAARDWHGVLDLRDRCRAALARGKQLWPVASHAEYRIALEADPSVTACVLVDGAGHFALGPLSEVSASTHTWAEMAPHLLAGPVASATAHERLLRGENLDPAATSRLTVERWSELPLYLSEWEPVYPVASYTAYDADFPAPEVPSLSEVGPRSTRRARARSRCRRRPSRPVPNMDH